MEQRYSDKLIIFIDTVGEDRFLQALDIIKCDARKKDPLFGTFVKLREAGLWGLERYDFSFLVSLVGKIRNSRKMGI